MTAPRIMTSVTARVPQDREQELVDGYRELGREEKPDGFLRSELLRGDGGRWLLQTLWRDRDALLALRAAGKPPAVVALLDRLGAEHSHELLHVEDSF
jgi:hypothetical protein